MAQSYQRWYSKVNGVQGDEGLIDHTKIILTVAPVESLSINRAHEGPRCIIGNAQAGRHGATRTDDCWIVTGCADEEEDREYKTTVNRPHLRKLMYMSRRHPTGFRGKLQVSGDRDGL